MNIDTPQPSLLLMSERVYRVLLVAYPTEFRRDYGRHMLQVFRDVCRDAYGQGGAWGLMIWWGATLLDLLHTAFAERRKVGFTMSNFKLSQWSGWLSIFGGIFFIVSSYSHGESTHLWEGWGTLFVIGRQLSAAALVLGMILVTLGLLGIYSRFRTMMNLFGKLALGTAIIGAGATSVGWLLTLTGSNPLWGLFMPAWMLHLAGISVFGGYATTIRLLSKWNFALLIGSAMPITTILLIARQFGSPGMDWGGLLVLLLIGVGWVLTGVALNREPVETVEPALIR